MEQRENQRVRLSKRLIKESLTRLLQTESIHKVSIRTLCEEAGVNRSTFYKYYGSQYDVLEELEADVIRQICGSLEEADSDSRRIELICLYIEQNMATVQMLVGNNIDPEFPKKLFDLPQLKGMIVTRLSQQFDGESQEYIYTFIINGCYCMIQRWLSQDTQRPFDEVAQLMRDMIGKICM